MAAVLLVSCMAMTGAYGWGLGRFDAERVIFAVALAGADLGGFYLIMAGSSYSATKEFKAARWAKCGALLCCLVTVTGMVGFQSEIRESQVKSRKDAAKITSDTLSWSKDLAVNAVGKGAGKEKNAAATLEAGISAVGRLAEQQAARLSTGVFAMVEDGQALAIARVTGLSEDEARSWYIIGLSIVLLLIQYACGWHYGFTRHRLEPIIAAQNVVGRTQFNGDKAFNSSKSPPFSEDSARERLDLLLAGGFQLDKYGAYSFLGREFGWTTPRTIRWLERQPDLTIKAKRRRRSVQSGENLMPTLNGNGRAHMA